jgi:hypothetical protein
MKKFLLFSLLILVAVPLSSETNLDASSKGSSFCVKFRKVYPFGVAASKKTAGKSKAKIARGAYRKYVRFDVNQNGIVCERGEPRFVSNKTPITSTTLPVGNVGATPTTIPIPGSFGSGTKRVGATGINPGRYLTTTAANCYWARLSGFGGTLEEIITNDNAPGSHVIVDISASDAGFTSSRCGLWIPYVASPPASFGDGVWSINDEMRPGTWSATFTGTCYWARLSGFGGTLEDIITNDNVTGSAIVQIQSSDVGFLSSRCGTWTKIG